ncbi:LAFA_0E15544g1_1 [Lachancea sp. 'fantastica']|nr:LAFA_0E15544g1_1 [Lachancea sp. 'fantastica']
MFPSTHSRVNADLFPGEKSASSKLRDFLHRTEGHMIYSAVDEGKSTSRYQGKTYKNNPLATSTTDVHEVKNVNPFVEEFVATRVKLEPKTASTVRFGSNQTKIFEEDSVLGCSNRQDSIQPSEIDSILIVKEQEMNRSDDSFNAGWDETIVIQNPVVLEGMLRCWEACGIPDTEFDSGDLVMTVQKLSYGILQALANQGAVSKLVKERELAEVSEDFEECWLDLLEALQSEEQLEKLSTDLSEQFEINASQKNQNAILMDRVRSLESQLECQSSMKSEVEAHVAKLRELTKLYDDQSSKYHDLCTKMSKMELDLEEKTLKNDSLLKENLEIREEFSVCEIKLATSQSQVRRLERMASQNQREADRVLEQKNQYCNQLMLKCENVEKAWQEDYSRINNECEKLSMQSQNLKLGLQASKEDLERYKLKTAESLIMLHASRKRVQELEGKFSEYSAKTATTSAQVEELLEFKQKAKARIVSLKNSKMELKKRNEQMQTDEKLMRSQLNEIIDQYEYKDTENHKLLIELEKLKKTFQETKDLFKAPISPLGYKSAKKHRPLRILTNRVNA